MVEVDMGRVTVPVRIANQEDRYAVRRGLLTADQVRAVEVPDAVVDTGATGLMVPSRYIAQLGLRSVRTRPVRTVGGNTTLNVYEPVQLTV